MSDVQEDVTLIAHIRAMDEGASQIFGNVKSAAGILGGALVGMYQQSIGSALKYGEAIEKVAFLTGMSTQKSSALIGAFRAQGFTTDEATMSMQRLTMRLGRIDTQMVSTGKVSKQNAQSLSEMGLSVQDLQKSGGDLTLLLPKIIDHMKNMHDPLLRDALATQLFGRNFASIAPLIEAGGGAFKRALTLSSLLGTSLSGTQVAQLHEYKSSMEIARMAVQGLSLQIAFQALPVFQRMEDMVIKGIEWWNKLSPSVHKTALEILKLTAVFGTLLGGAAALNGPILGLLKDIPGVGAAAEMIIPHFAMLFSIIGPLIAVFLILRNEWQHSIAIQKAFAPVLQGLRFLFSQLKDTLGIVISIVQSFFSAFAGGGRASLDSFIVSLAGPLGMALGNVSVLVGRLNEFLIEHKTQIVATAAVVRAFVATALALLHQALSVVVQVAEYLWSKTWPALQSAFVQLKPVVGEIVGVFRDDLIPAFIMILPLLQVIAKIIVAGLGVAIPIAIQLAVTSIRLLVDIFRILGIIIKGVVTIITDLVHGDWKKAWADAQAMVGALGTAVGKYLSDMWDGIVRIVKGLWPSISGDLAGFAANIGKFFSGIGTKVNAVWSDFANRPIYWIVYLIAEAVGFLMGLDLKVGSILLGLAAKAYAFGVQFVEAILAELPGLPGRVWGFLGGIIGVIITQGPGIIQQAGKMARDFVEAIMNVVATLPGKVWTIIANAFGSAGGQAKKALHDAGVPGFAQGAVVGPGFGGARMAVVGEGNEAEVIAKASSLVRAGMQAAQGGGGTGGGFGNLTVEFHVDGRMIEKRVSKITGKRMRLQGAGAGSAA